MILPSFNAKASFWKNIKTYYRFDTSNNMLGHENILKLRSLSFEGKRTSINIKDI